MNKKRNKIFIWFIIYEYRIYRSRGLHICVKKVGIPSKLVKTNRVIE